MVFLRWEKICQKSSKQKLIESYLLFTGKGLALKL
jgi:hypothetical protein